MHSLIHVTKLSNGRYVCQGNIWSRIDLLLADLKKFWSGHPVRVENADPRTDAFWLEVCRK